MAIFRKFQSGVRGVCLLGLGLLLFQITDFTSDQCDSSSVATTGRLDFKIRIVGSTKRGLRGQLVEVKFTNLYSEVIYLNTCLRVEFARDESESLGKLREVYFKIVDSSTGKRVSESGTFIDNWRGPSKESFVPLEPNEVYLDTLYVPFEGDYWLKKKTKYLITAVYENVFTGEEFGLEGKNVWTGKVESNTIEFTFK